MTEKDDRWIWEYRQPSLFADFFYLRICLFTLPKMDKMISFQSKMDFSSANSRFGIQNDRTYLPRITRETCIAIWFGFQIVVFAFYKIFRKMSPSRHEVDRHRSRRRIVCHLCRRTVSEENWWNFIFFNFQMFSSVVHKLFWWADFENHWFSYFWVVPFSGLLML